MALPRAGPASPPIAQQQQQLDFQQGLQAMSFSAALEAKKSALGGTILAELATASMHALKRSEVAEKRRMMKRVQRKH